MIKAIFRKIDEDSFIYFVRSDRKVLGSGISSFKPYLEGTKLITSGIDINGVDELREG